MSPRSPSEKVQNLDKAFCTENKDDPCPTGNICKLCELMLVHTSCVQGARCPLRHISFLGDICASVCASSRCAAVRLLHPAHLVLSSSHFLEPLKSSKYSYLT